MFEENPMEPIYQRRCAKYIYVVPEGLRELMSDISREVLRSQPTELCCFIADYLDSLMIVRENARIAAKFVDNITEVSCIVGELLNKTRCTLKEAIEAARIIQKCFRAYIKRKRLPLCEIPPIDPKLVICRMILKLNISYETAVAAASVIQRAWRCYLRRKEFWRTQFQYIDWRHAAKISLTIYKRLVPSYEFQMAATTIQAAYKGYYIRKYMRYLAACKNLPPDRSAVISYLEEQYSYQISEEHEEETQRTLSWRQQHEDEDRNSLIDNLEVQKILHDYIHVSYDKIKLQSPKENIEGAAKTPQTGVHSFWISMKNEESEPVKFTENENEESKIVKFEENDLEGPSAKDDQEFIEEETGYINWSFAEE